MDELVPIPRENWTDLRDLFRTNWPAHELPHNVFQNYIDWIQIDAKIANLQVFSLNGAWRSDGTFIIIDRYELYCYTLEESNGSLLRALKLVDWDYSNVGLFNEEDELVGWCLHSNLGFLSYLHVDDRCRNRGFGELMVRAISRKVAEKGLNVYGGVRPDNGPSRRLFQKIGFEQRQAIAWIRSRAGKLAEWGIS
ncbi:hypothetical protein quinque_011057 [Culex quinquefasciatus]